MRVRYRSRGVEHFYYQIPAPREVRAFSLTLTVPNLPVAEVNYPEGCLTPTSVEATANARGTTLRWVLDRSVTTAGMGIALPKPDQPGAKVAMVLSRSPYALMLLVVSVCLTFLLRGKGIDLLEVSLLCGAYAALFLVMAPASDFFPGIWTGFWGSIAVGSVLTLVLSWRLFRAEPRRTRTLALALLTFFTLIYPARAALAGRLLKSLDEGVDEDVESEWDQEIARRLEELETGKVRAVPWAKARAAILRPR